MSWRLTTLMSAASAEPEAAIHQIDDAILFLPPYNHQIGIRPNGEIRSAERFRTYL